MQTESNITTPSDIIPHQGKYNPDAWKEYSIEELGSWVHLLHKRAQHRSDPAKRAKDLEDARNYWEMMGAWLGESLNPSEKPNS